VRNDDDVVHFVVELQPRERHGIRTEGLWGERVADGRLRLRNTPFLVPDLSMDDIVFAKKRRGVLTFAGVSLRGGHSTYWIMTAGPDSWKSHWTRLKLLGCRYESTGLGDGRIVLAMDVPARTNLEDVLQVLDEGTAAGVWDYEEAHRGHL
jgi:hypothetical protein